MSDNIWWKKPQPVLIGNVVDKILKDKNFVCRRKNKLKDIEVIWMKIVDKETLLHTKINQYHKNKLYLIVDSPAYLFEFNNFYKQNLLEKFKSCTSEIYINDILLKVGDISE